MKKSFLSFLTFTRTQTIKDTLVVTFGNGLSTAFSVLSIFLIARILGPADFGLYVTTWAIVVILIDSIDLAINSGIVKFASQSTADKDSLIKYGFFLKLFLGLIITAVFGLLSQPLAAWLYPSLTTPLLLSSLFILITFLFRFPRSILQSEKKFFKDTLIDVTISFIRLLSVLAFYFFFKLTILSSLVAYLLAAVIGLILGVRFISWDFLKAKVTAKARRTFFHFQKWLTFGFIIAAVHGRIDSAILLKLAGPENTGIYQAAYRFFAPVLQLAAALSLVFAPRFASFSDYSQTKTYLHKAAKLTLGLAGLVLLLIPLAPILINLIFGSAYQTAVLPTRILTLGFAFFIAGSPYVAHLVYAVNKTKTFFIINLAQLVLIVTLDLILIPVAGAVGAALAVSLTLITVNSLLAYLALSYKS